jgi:RNA-directed DNA polymerase
MIQTYKHLVYTLQCSASINELNKIIIKVDDYYKKKLDGKRILYPSNGRLKEIQQRIKSQILDKIELPHFLFGGVKGKTNISNAKMHKGKKYKFTTDLKKFFPSISWKLVYGMFLANGFSADVARVLTILTTYKGMLPQGCPTSTSIANLVFIPVDFEINNFCIENEITYTRFVDDLSMSSPNDFKDITQQLLDFVRKSNFRISHKKTFYGTNVSVTGIEPRNNSLRAPKSFLNTLSNATLLSSAEILGKKNYLKQIKKENINKSF